MKSYENTHLNIKSWAEEDRPREKLLIKGKAALSDAELLGILIATGIQNMTAIDIAKVILQSVNNDLNQLARLSVKDLAKFKGSQSHYDSQCLRIREEKEKHRENRTPKN